MQDISINSEKLIKTIGLIVKNYRIKQGKTIYKISAEISMSKSTWREVEIGACKDIKITTLWKIAEGLDIPPAQILKEVSAKLGNTYTLTGINL